MATIEEYLRPAEVAALLRVTIKTLAQWRWRGKHLPYRKLGSLVRYRRSDVIELLDGARRPATETNTSR